MVDSSSPIFIVGRPRSGTTLMASLLDAHPRLAILPVETEIFSLWLGVSRKFGFDHMWSSFISDPKFDMLELDWGLARQRIQQSDSSMATVSSMLSTISEFHANTRNKQRWGEKTPQHFRCLDNIFEAYPAAQVICMLRDPRAIYSSLLSMPWNQDNVEGNARNWIDFLQILHRRSHDPRIYVVRYEQLVTEPIPVLKNLCLWLGEEFTEAMLDRSGLTHRLHKRDGWRLEHRLKALDTITPESVDKWKSKLTEEQVRITEHICGRQMRQYGYGPVSNGLPFVAGIRFDVNHRLRQARTIAYRGKRKTLMLAKRILRLIHGLKSHQLSN